MGPLAAVINVDYRPVVPGEPSRLTAPQVARRLGVKTQTVYAYVSRGHLISERAADGRTSLFDPHDVERLARRGRPRRTSRGPTVDVAIETAITEIDGTHIRYRGLDAVNLSRTSSFEQVATLLWTGLMPPVPPAWPVPAGPGHRPETGGALERIRLAVALGELVPPAPERPTASAATELVAAGPGLIATMVGALPLLAADRTPVLHLDPPVGSAGPRSVRGTVAGRLSVRLQARRPDPSVVSMLNAALVLLADHEMAPSTFAVRIAASVRADAPAVVSTGLGPMSGALHGRASRHVRALLADAAHTSATAAVERWNRQPGGVPGVGHGLYRRGDPRAVELLGRLLGAGGPPQRLRLIEEVLAVVGSSGLGRPNVDMALGAMGHVWSMSEDAGEAVFAVARTAGWLAHAAEEYARRPLRFRTRAAYVGVTADRRR